MNRNVYLFELDSVKKSPAEIEHGQKCLYDEIVNKGNKVVITMNQLTDSEVFLYAIKNEKTYNNIVSLFELGFIKISRYIDESNTIIRSPSQYIQNSIKTNIHHDRNTFIYSALPVDGTEKELLLDIKNALKYSDLSTLKERRKSIVNVQEQYRIDYLIRFVQLILTISPLSQAHNPEKQTKAKSFIDFMTKILTHSVQLDFTDSIFSNDDFYNAVYLLKNIDKNINLTHNKNKRSNWLSALQKFEQNIEVEIAKIIVNICYNYAVEDSIYKVSKHYDKNSFFEDFLLRLHSEMELSKLNIREHSKSLEMPFWDTAERLMSKRKYNDVPPTEDVYEKNFSLESKKWKRIQIKKYIKQYSIYVFMILAAIAIVLISMQIENLLSSLHIPILWTYVLTGAFWPFLCSFLYSRFKLPDIFDTLQSAKIILLDSVRFIKALKEVSYRNKGRGELNG